jgi:hypothetical protein
MSYHPTQKAHRTARRSPITRKINATKEKLAKIWASQLFPGSSSSLRTLRKRMRKAASIRYRRGYIGWKLTWKRESINIGRVLMSGKSPARTVLTKN